MEELPRRGFALGQKLPATNPERLASLTYLHRDHARLPLCKALSRDETHTVVEDRVCSWCRIPNAQLSRGELVAQ